jgi:hypothetical protein
MSRRTREGQRLAEDVAVVINRAGGGKSMVSRAEANRIKAEDERERLERRASSMRVLLFRQYAPWLAAFGVLILGGVEWLFRWLDTTMVALTVASMVGLALAWAAWMIGRRTKRWRSRVHLAAGIASAWLLLAAAVGPSWRAVLVLVLGTVLSSSSWWKANRPPHPKAPSPVAVPVSTVQSIPAMWDAYLGASGAVLPGSRLSDPDTSRANCEVYMINLRPGKQSFTGTVANLSLIAGGLHTPIKNIVLEPHKDQNPNHVKLTIVKVSPIDETMPYSGARIAGAQRNAIEIGPYGDGDGFAQWQMWRPGEKPMTGSWLSGLVIGKTGGGKSRLMELLAAGYMATGSAIVWFADPQGGASSPSLQKYADWYVSGERVAQMIGVLEAVAEGREREMGVREWSRFEPSPERPGIVVILEEGHVIIKRFGKRLSDLARKTQKVGISFIVFTQGASLESLGDDILRASLTTNLIVMRTGSNQTKNLLPGLTVDPEMLPEIPGFGYTIGMGGSRTAPYRAELIEEPERWFKQYKMPTLDPLSANAAGDSYGLRREATAQEQEANRQWVEQMSSGEIQPTLDAEVEDEPMQDEQPMEGRAFHVVKFPESPAARPQDRPQDKPSRQRIIALVGQGVTRTAEIQAAVGLSPSQTAAVLKQLLEDGHLERPTAGVYAIAGSASTPER